ncbi:LysR family transcriptional regulator [Vibrio harveyi]|uniref:LysR family transcriptional regulator n=1 Tax=Vibrio harveyi TaxID=669 RepID=A0ABN4L8D3_VIBHA|nr:LysR family transcriptional regulator [Vibrio harveyi]AMG00655.1 LysR family transcriptional regulator [Vibrio harveyi]HDM8146902.1 LysR family transcriptional regulator [Vibrio harveyi]
MNKDLDLNLLKILVLLERHRQLKPVAKALGKSEASISKYLTRLRTQLEDELFIRHAHHFEPTDYLKRKLPEITDALGQLESCLVRREFDPLSYEKSISICLPQSAQQSFGDLLLIDLMELFPNAYINVESSTDNTIDDILVDKVDMQLHYFNEEYPKTIHQQFIGYAPAVIVVPEELGINDLETACKLDFILLELAGWKDREQVTKRALEQSGININRVATIGNITSLLKVIRSKAAATILLEYQKPIEGYTFIPVPESFYPQGRPKVVIQMKQSHRYNSMHQLLTDAIAKYVIS